MGKIFEYFGFIFYFFSNEHEPIHVHVKKGGEECIFDLIIKDGQLSGVHSAGDIVFTATNGKKSKFKSKDPAILSSIGYVDYQDNV